MIYVEDDEHDRQAEERLALLTDLLTRARARMNGLVGISAMSLMCEIDEALAPRTAPNTPMTGLPPIAVIDDQPDQRGTENQK